jgi:hemerythrin-like domain-containing protein
MPTKTTRPDPVKLLKDQHREVEGLFKAYEKLGEDARREKLEMFAQIADMLAAHAAIEERLFYPACRSEDTEDELRESLEEHLAAKRVIRDLLEIDSGDEQFDAKMTLLQELIDHHVEEEEKELLPKANKLLGDQAPALAVAMQELFTDLMSKEPRKEVPAETGEAPPLE